MSIIYILFFFPDVTSNDQMWHQGLTDTDPPPAKYVLENVRVLIGTPTNEMEPYSRK